MVLPYLSDMINDHKAAKTRVWKIQISVPVNFISSKDTGEIFTIYVWSDNENIMWSNETDNIMKKLFQSFLDNYQKEEKLMKVVSGFKFESVELLDYILSLNYNKIKIKELENIVKRIKREDIDFTSHQRV